MIKKIKAIGIEGVIICLLPLVHQLVNMFGVNANLMYVPLLLILLFNMDKLTLPVYYFPFGIAFLFTYLGCTILSGQLSLYGIAYIALLGVFYITIPIIGKRASKYYADYVLFLLFAGALFLLPQVLLNIGSVSLDQITNALNVEGDSIVRNRLTFGFMHPNTAAYMIATEILLLNAYFRMKKNWKNRIVVLGVGLLLFVGLLGTGSRTAIISVLALFAIQVGFAAINLLPKLKPLLYFLCIIIVLYLLFTTGIVGTLLNRSSGRTVALSTLYSALVRTDRLWFGTGVAGISAGNISAVLGQEIIIDGWYMHMFASTGIIGLVVIFAGITSLFWHLLKNTPVGSERNFMFAIMFFLLCYGFAENVIFVPGILLSVVCWILIFALYYKSQGVVNESSSVQ